MKKKKEQSRFIKFTAKWLLILSAISFMFIIISNKTKKTENTKPDPGLETLDRQLDSIIAVQFPEAKIEAIGEPETLEAGKESLPSFRKAQELEMTLETLLQIEGIDNDIVRNTKAELDMIKEKLAEEEKELRNGRTQTIRRINIIHPNGTHTTFFQRKCSDSNNSEIIEIYNY